jgi:hypothetical protein
LARLVKQILEYYPGVLENLKENGGVKKKLEHMREYVADLKDWSKVVDALLEGAEMRLRS